MNLREFLNQDGELFFCFRDSRGEVRAKYEQALKAKVLSENENASSIQRNAIILYLDALLEAKKGNPDGGPHSWRDWARRSFLMPDYLNAKYENELHLRLLYEQVLKNLVGDKIEDLRSLMVGVKVESPQPVK